MYSGVGTQEVNWRAFNYQNVLGGCCTKGVERMVYDMIDKSYVEEDQIEYCISLATSTFSYLNTKTYLHGIATIRGRLYAYDR